MATRVDLLRCPFCDFVDSDTYFLLQHVELIHPENGESPFLVKDMTVADRGLGRACHDQQHNLVLSNGRSLFPPKQEDQQYTTCPYRCGESILLSELAVHSDLHLAESMAFEEESRSTKIEYPTGPSNDNSELHRVATSFDTHISQSLRNLATSQSDTSATNKRVRTSLKGIFLGSPTSIRNSSHVEADSHKTRRLGVSCGY